MKYKVLALSIAAAMFIGCGGGSSSSDSSSTTDTQTGVFVDAPVKGLNYETSSGIKGVTDTQGKFNYRFGDTVMFKIGNAKLGSTIASSVVTPLNIASDEHESFNIAYFLQNLDADGNLSNGINIPKDVNVESVDFSDESNVSGVLNRIKFQLQGKYKFADISIDNAKNNFLGNVQENVFYNVDEIAGKTWYMVFVNDFNIVTEPIYSAIIDLNDGRFKEQNQQSGEWENDDYIQKVSDYVLKVTDKDNPNDIEYLMFYKIDHGFQVIGTDENGVQFKKQNIYFFDSKNIANEFVKNINKRASAEKITDFNDINNKWFYQFEISDKGELSTVAIELNDTKAERYFANYLTLNPIYKYDSQDIDFKDGKFGYYDEDDEEWNYYYVYKIPLDGKTIDIGTFVKEDVFDKEDKGLVKYFKEHNLTSKFTFTKGNIYCSLLWWECWLDKDAMNEVINNIYKTEKIVSYESKRVTDVMFTNNNKCISYRPIYGLYKYNYYLDVLNMDTKEVTTYQLVDDLNTSTSIMGTLYQNGNYIYLTHYDKGSQYLRVYKIDNNCELEHLNDVNLSENVYTAGTLMSIYDNKLVIGGDSYIYAYYDVSDPQNPKFIKTLEIEDGKLGTDNAILYVNNMIFKAYHYRYGTGSFDYVSLMDVYDENGNLTKEYNLSEIFNIGPALIELGLAVNADNSEVFIYSRNSGKFFVIDLSDMNYKFLFENGGSFVDVYGNTVYDVVVNGKVYVYNIENNEANLIRSFIFNDIYDEFKLNGSMIYVAKVSSDGKYIVVNYGKRDENGGFAPYIYIYKIK